MTVITMITASMLTIGPSMIVYQALDLNRYNAYNPMLQAGGIYLLSQVTRLIILAIVMPLLFGKNA